MVSLRSPFSTHCQRHSSHDDSSQEPGTRLEPLPLPPAAVPPALVVAPPPPRPLPPPARPLTFPACPLAPASRSLMPPSRPLAPPSSAPELEPRLPPAPVLSRI